MPSLANIGIHPPPERPKTLSFCVFVRHAFERQSLCARFCHEGVNDFDALVYSCAPVFNFIRLPAIGDTTKCWSPKKDKMGFIAARGRQNKPIETKFGTYVHYGSAVAHAALNLDLISKRKSVQEPPNVKICPKLRFWAAEANTKNTFTWNFVCKCIPWVSSSTQNLTLVSKRYSVQESPKCQNLPKIVVFGHGKPT